LFSNVSTIAKLKSKAVAGPRLVMRFPIKILKLMPMKLEYQVFKVLYMCIYIYIYNRIKDN